MESYRQGKALVHPGDVLILYSDGIVEASRDGKEEFGEERLWALIRASWSQSAAGIRDQILNQVRSFLRGEQPQDDMTLVVIRMGNGKGLATGVEQSKPDTEAMMPLPLNSTGQNPLS